MISVCVATFNAEPYIWTQLESIMAQIAAEDEIIIFDDHSTDDTIKIIQSLKEPRIRLFEQQERQGVILNFECALKVAKGDVIFLSDHDDVWLPNKVTKCLAALESNVAVVTDCQVVDEQLSLIAPSFFAIRKSRPGIVKNLLTNSYMGCCMAFRREVLAAALPFPKHIPMHDAWLGLVAELTGSVLFIAEPLLLYRRHQANVSPLHSRNSLYTKLKSRLALLTALLGRRLAGTTLFRRG